jgi:hypothetical protein
MPQNKRQTIAWNSWSVKQPSLLAGDGHDSRVKDRSALFLSMTLLVD